MCRGASTPSLRRVYMLDPHGEATGVTLKSSAEVVLVLAPRRRCVLSRQNILCLTVPL